MNNLYYQRKKELEDSKCPDCSGRGKCDDSGLGDIYFREWKCPKCNGTGVKKK